MSEAARFWCCPEGESHKGAQSLGFGVGRFPVAVGRSSGALRAVLVTV